MKDIINYTIPEKLVKENDLKAGDIINCDYNSNKKQLIIRQIYKSQRPKTKLLVKAIEITLVVDQVS